MNKDLLIQLVKTSFKLRYNNSLLGFVWVILKPFLMFLINYFVWTNLFPSNIEFFAPKLMLGIVIWTFFQEGIVFGMNGLLDKAAIILKVNFNRQIAVVASTLMAVINFLINMVLFFIIFMIYNVATGRSILLGISPFDFILHIFLFAVVMCILYVFILGVSMFLSIIMIRLRDLQHIMELFFSIAVWLTPVMVQLDFAKTKSDVYYNILSSNPIGWVIEQGRNLLIFNKIENVSQMIVFLVISIIILVLGNRYFARKVKYVAEFF